MTELTYAGEEVRFIQEEQTVVIDRTPSLGETKIYLDDALVLTFNDEERRAFARALLRELTEEIK